MRLIIIMSIYVKLNYYNSFGAASALQMSENPLFACSVLSGGQRDGWLARD